MKWITLLPMLLSVLPAHAEKALPAPEVRLIDVHTTQQEGGLKLELQVKPQKDVQLTGAVEVASPIVVTDEKGATLETADVKELDYNRPVDKILGLTCKGMPDGDWFRVGGALRITQGGYVRQGDWHTCPTSKESRFTEGGITFTVNGEADRALAGQVWNGRTPRITPKGMVWVSCNAADANRIERWEITGRKWTSLGFIHRETRQVDGRFIWFMCFDSEQREVRLSPQLFGTVQTVEVPVDCICGINGQTKKPTPLPEGDSTPGSRIQVERFAWNDDDFPGMMGMVVPMAPLSLTFSVYDEHGKRLSTCTGPVGEDKIRVTDATGRLVPCKIHARGGIFTLDFREVRPVGTWLKIEGTLPVSTTSNPDTTQQIRLDGIYTLRGRRH